jgi:hypothetical protein
MIDGRFAGIIRVRTYLDRLIYDRPLTLPWAPAYETIAEEDLRFTFAEIEPT